MPVSIPRHDAIAEARRVSGSLPALLVNAVQVAASIAAGLHGRRRVGQGEAFWQYRHYVPGDAPNAIDWRRSGRSDDVYVRQFEWEAVQSVWLWRDGTPSMDYASGTALPTKRHRADVLVLALAQLLMRAGERVSVLGAPPRSGHGRLRLEQVAADLVRADAAGGPLPPATSLPAHGELVLVGDFLDPVEQLSPLFSAYAERRLAGYLVQVIDPAEELLPFDGRVRFAGLEADGEMLVPRVDRLRGAYGERFQAHRAALADLARQLGWTLVVHRTDHPPQPALLALYQALTQTHGGEP
ncbi:MAG: DUF58 domain-containing protein [Rhodospirillaceae bacterium]|nr:DUF58 domain-containing protein [Rhodospirillaceae bacterium]